MLSRQVVLLCAAVSGVCHAAVKPNVIVIVADDLGYGELSIQGNKDIETPHIDSIAHNGVRFTNGYVTNCVCAPTRAALMTGRYQQRFGFEFNPGPETQAPAQFGLPSDERTLPERLKELGYRTGMVGKWHLGYRKDSQPMSRGFDEFFGFLAGAHPYRHAKKTEALIVRGNERVEEADYLTDAFGREAAAFIDRCKQDEPFFLYLPFNAVHAPLQMRDEDSAALAKFPEKRKIFLGMVRAMDDAVGKVLAKLEEKKLTENTLIFFVSDNGGPTLQTTSVNEPLRGTKGTVFEGGVRVPFMVQWPARLPKGAVYDLPVSSLDISPTTLLAAGGSLPTDKPTDGVDLVPYLTGENKNRPHESLYWRSGQQWAIRKGDFKYVVVQRMAPMLFDLSKDVGEQDNLAEKQPEKLKELEEAYDGWNKEMIPPKWGQKRLRKG